MYLHPWLLGDQVLAADLNSNFNLMGTSRFVTLNATESITVGQAISAAVYNATPVALDGSVVTGTLSSGTNTISVTVGANSNRLLLIQTSTTSQNSGATSISSPTWNGGAATNHITYRDQTGLGYNLCGATSWFVAPTTGTHTLSITAPQPGKYVIYSLFNVNQTSPVESATGGFAQSISGSNIQYTTVGTTEAVFGYITVQSGATGITFGGNSFVSNQTSIANLILAGSAGLPSQVSAGTVMTAAWGGNNISIMAIAAVTPISNPTGGAQLASSAAVNTRSTSFIGFANNTASTGAVVDVITKGIVSGFTGLTPCAQYYLNDTNGTIGTSAGTNTRKIGIALTATSLLITNVW